MPLFFLQKLSLSVPLIGKNWMCFYLLSKCVCVCGRICEYPTKWVPKCVIWLLTFGLTAGIWHQLHWCVSPPSSRPLALERRTKTICFWQTCSLQQLFLCGRACSAASIVDVSHPIWVEMSSGRRFKKLSDLLHHLKKIWLRMVVWYPEIP